MVIAYLDCTGKICAVSFPHHHTTLQLSWPVTLHGEGLSCYVSAPYKELWKGANPWPHRRTLTHAALVSRETLQQPQQSHLCMFEGASMALAAGGPSLVSWCYTVPWNMPNWQKLLSPPAAASTISYIATAMSINRFGAEGLFLWLCIAGILSVSFWSTDLCLVV